MLSHANAQTKEKFGFSALSKEFQNHRFQMKNKDRYFLQQESLLKIKSELKAIEVINKNIAGAAKDSTDAVAIQFENEKRIRELKADEAKFNYENKRTATGLTQAKIEEYATMESLLPLLEDETLKQENIAQVQAAIVAYQEQQNLLLQLVLVL